MSKDYTPTYRVEYRDNTKDTQGNAFNFPQWSSWDTRYDGKPTIKNLEQWRVSMNESFAQGGVNYHVSVMYGVIVHISHARIIRQATGEIVAEVKAPSFEVI